jgi:hypothetical protein
LTAITTLWHWRNNAFLHFELKSARFLAGSNQAIVIGEMADTPPEL